MTGIERPDDDYEETGRFPIVIQGLRYTVPLHCPHRAGRLDHGHVNGRRRTITCPLHHSMFCLETGAQLGGPECGVLDVSVQAVEAFGTTAEAPGSHPLSEEEDALR